MPETLMVGATTLRVRPTPERPLSRCVIGTVSHGPNGGPATR